MANAGENEKFINDLNKLEKLLASPKAADLGNACEIYTKVKPILEAVLPVLEKIPAIGKIAAAVRFLMTIADSFCKES
jgi:hypothetical protein